MQQRQSLKNIHQQAQQSEFDIIHDPSNSAHKEAEEEINTLTRIKENLTQN